MYCTYSRSRKKHWNDEERNGRYKKYESLWGEKK